MRFPPEPVREYLRAKACAAWYRHVTLRRGMPKGVRPFILTGPPRSGTSLLAALVSRKPNVIAVNEPRQLWESRLKNSDPNLLLRGCLAAAAQRAIRRGEIVTKTSAEGEPTTDTFNRGSAVRAVPVHIDPDEPLCAGLKGVLIFMNRLEQFRKGWPELKVVIILRDPAATIRSWRHSFGWQPQLDDPNAGEKFALHARVPKEGTPFERRAHMWRLLRNEALAQVEAAPEQVRLIRYEDLLNRPRETMIDVFRHIGAERPEDPIDLSDVRPQKRPQYEDFTDEELAAIRRICAESPADTSPVVS